MAVEWMNDILEKNGCDCIQAQAVWNEDTDETIFVAENCGPEGNQIILQGNGSATWDNIVSDWNTANPNNQVSASGAVGAIPDAETTIQLSGGSRGCGFNTKEDHEVLKGLFLGRYTHQQFKDVHNVKQCKMWDTL